jgi:WD40 repeat protein
LATIDRVGTFSSAWGHFLLVRRRTLAGHSDSILELAFSPDGKTLLSRSSDGMAKLWDMAALEELLTRRWPFATSGSQLQFAPDSRALACWAGREYKIPLYLLPTALPAEIDPEKAP